ncbi:MAG: DNA adenine methylase [Lactobacillaceae bacterium]|nr:DNA adenine methylase [Lactobacillaceae bacterium]
MKWAGGKRQLLPELAKYVPDTYGTYFEPFLGGGAFLLSAELGLSGKAVVNDFNPELINAWKMVKTQPKKLIAQLEIFKQANSKEFYLELRGWDRSVEGVESHTQIERAARFIMMNKTGFNGLWRVNKAGQNNVPYGSYANPKIFDADNILHVSQFLKAHQVEFKVGDFAKAVKKADTGDFVYFDPPYIPISTTASFTSYSSEFGLAEQVKLRDTFKALKDRGVKVLLSNSDVPMIHELYAEIGTIEQIQVHRAIAANAKSRTKVGEVLIRSW